VHLLEEFVPFAGPYIGQCDTDVGQIPEPGRS
jgi:hypothetical protein